MHWYSFNKLKQVEWDLAQHFWVNVHISHLTLSGNKRLHLGSTRRRVILNDFESFGEDLEMTDGSWRGSWASGSWHTPPKLKRESLSRKLKFNLNFVTFLEDVHRELL